MTKHETITTMDTPLTTCKIVFCEDGDYLVDNDKTTGPLPLSSDGLAYVLPENSANRHFFAISKLEKIKATGVTETILEYRASRKIGPVGTHIPNKKLISYLPEAEQAEYKAIIDRAIAARDAAKAKPMTELEKAQAKLAKAQKALAELMAKAKDGDNN